LILRSLPIPIHRVGFAEHLRKKSKEKRKLANEVIWEFENELMTSRSLS